MLDEIFVTGRTSLHSDTASVLEPVLGERGSLDVAEMRNCYDHILVCIEVLRIELFGRHRDFSPARVTVLFLHLEGLVLDDLHLHAFVCKHILAVADELHELVILALELLAFKSGKLTQTHLDDGSSLRIGKSECCNELALRLFDVL